MSEFKVEVVKVGPVEKHPNADSLGITKVYDYPVIVKKGWVGWLITLRSRLTERT